MVLILMSQSEHLSLNIFKNGLVFGDPEQIKYIKQKAHEIALEEEQRENGLRLFKITACIESTTDFDIWAEDEFQAISLANKELNDDMESYFGSMEFDIMDVVEIVD